MPGKLGKQELLLALMLAACGAGPDADAEVLFRDDFNGRALDTHKWNVANWRLGRTELREAPRLTNGHATLRVDTYDSENPGEVLRGQEIFTKMKFSRREGLELSARVRVRKMPAGLVTSFFTYSDQQRGVDRNSDGENDHYADEIDFEFLSKRINADASSDPVSLTAWNDWNRDDPSPVYDDDVHHTSTTESLAGLRLNGWNIMKIRWTKGGVAWYVNGRRVWSESTVVPDRKSTLRFNFWAPRSHWKEAYSPALEPAGNPSENRTFYYDIDWVQVRSGASSSGAATRPSR